MAEHEQTVAALFVAADATQRRELERMGIVEPEPEATLEGNRTSTAGHARQRNTRVPSQTHNQAIAELLWQARQERHGA
jgi:hypothetical protein